MFLLASCMDLDLVYINLRVVDDPSAYRFCLCVDLIHTRIQISTKLRTPVCTNLSFRVYFSRTPNSLK
jgi:hypothetical protein